MDSDKSDRIPPFEPLERAKSGEKNKKSKMPESEFRAENPSRSALRAEKKKQKVLRREKMKALDNGVRDLNSSPKSHVSQTSVKNTSDIKDLPKIICSTSNECVGTDVLVTQDSSNLTAQTNKTQPTVSLTQRSQYTPQHMMLDDAKSQKKVASKLARQQVPKRQESKKKMTLFSHLVQMERNFNFGASISFSSKIYPAFITFGLQCADGILFDQNERCIRLIECLKMFVLNYVSPPSKELSRDMETTLSPSLSFLSQCRHLSAGMSTIIKFFKLKISDIFSYSEEEAKKELAKFLDNFFYERILFAGEAIINGIKSKINDNDVILTYSNSTLVLNALVGAANEGKMFRVIIADSKPRFEGRVALRMLSENGIKCTYININALCYVMGDATKIFISSSALLANGAVMCPVGSAMVAVVASFYNVPFLVCCETFKFIERAQTDAFVYNELGDPDDLITSTSWCPHMLRNWKDHQNISLLNIYHDIILPRFVTAVITELGTIPCSSAPVVLRVKN